ncbi:hypothetical protein D3C87_2100590 [compost metagenome]
MFQRDAVDHRFDGRVEQFHHQADEADHQHHGALASADIQQEAHDRQCAMQQQQLAEGRLSPEGGDEAIA